MMMAGDHHHSPNYHLVRINQPDIKEAPAKRQLNRGFKAWASCVWRATSTR